MTYRRQHGRGSYTLQRSQSVASTSPFCKRLLSTFRTGNSSSYETSGNNNGSIGNRVEIIRNVSDLHRQSSLSLEDISIWSRTVLEGRTSLFAPGPNKTTTDVSWFVGTTATTNSNNNTGSSNAESRHIDIYEHSLKHLPPDLNVKDPEYDESYDDTGGGGGGYALSRSKSVCDIQVLDVAAASSKTSEDASSASSSSSNSTGPSRSKVVRNKTILGSFPLFYKLSQSLSSLNTTMSNGHRGGGSNDNEEDEGGGGGKCPVFVQAAAAASGANVVER